MHQDAQVVPFKIYAVIAQAKTVQYPVTLLQLAKFVQFRAAHLLRQAAKITEDLQLQFLGHPGQLGRTGGCEDDLESVGHLIVDGCWLRVESQAPWLMVYS